MAQNKCPLCNGKVIDGYCDECGYNIPEEEEISDVYNYDPSDYNKSQDEYFPTDYPEEEFTSPNIEPYEQRDVEPYEQPPQNNAPNQNFQNPYANFSPIDNSHNNNIPNQTNPKKAKGPFSSDFFLILVVGFFVPYASILGIVKSLINYVKTKDYGYLITAAIFLVSVIISILIILSL